MDDAPGKADPPADPPEERQGTRQNYWQAALWPLLWLIVIAGVFIAGKMGALPGLENIGQQVSVYANSPWGLPVLIGVFCVGAFLGAPQFALMAGAVVAFGPWLGSFYAWAATLASGTVTFWAGRLGGEMFFKRYAGARAERVAAFLGRNAFKASALVRLVPTGPFIMVNMSFGMSGARFAPFLAGLGIGAVPKLALVALAGQGIVSAGQGSVIIAMAAAGGIALVWGGMIWARRCNMPKG